MSAKLTQSRFVSGPQDSLATSDIYQVTESSITNTAPSGSSEGVGALMDAVRTPYSQISIDPSESLNGGMMDGIRERVSNFFSGQGLDPFDFLDSTMDLAQTTLTDHTRQEHRTLLEYGGLTLEFDPYCLQLFTSIQDLVGGGFQDNLASFLANSALIQRLINCGVIPPMREIMGGISNDRTRREVALLGIGKSILPSVFDNGDTGNPSEGPVHKPLEVIANYYLVEEDEKESSRNKNRRKVSSNPGIRDNSSVPVDFDKNGIQGRRSLESLKILTEYVGGEEIKARYPNINRRILELYRLPPKGSFTLKEEYDELMELMSVIDEDWYKGSRGQDQVTDLTPFSRASRDATYLLTAHGESLFSTEMLIAKSHYPRSNDYLIEMFYPKAVV